MAFEMYPAGVLNPLNLANGASSSEAITEFITPSGGTVLSGDAMLIRLVMLDPSDLCSSPTVLPADHPTIELIPNGASATTIPLLNTTSAIMDGGTFIGTGYYAYETNGVFKIEVDFTAGVTGNSWEIRITNNAAGNREFVWVAGDSDSEISQPWLDISSTTSPAGELNYDTLIGAQILTGQTVNHTLDIVNKGTGPLTISDTPGVIGSTNFEIISVPGPIDPHTCGEMVIAFNAPDDSGQSDETFEIGSDDSLALSNPASLHNRQVQLIGTAGKLELMLLVDTSGSMSWEPASNSPPANPNESRWGRLKTAAGSSLTLLGDYGNGVGRFGISMFPDITQDDYPAEVAPSPSSADFYSPNDINPDNISDAIASLEDHTPVEHKGATPMGHGIERVIGAAGSGHFEGTPDAIAYNRRWMLLMTDGAHNSGPPEPEEFFTTAEGGGSCTEVGSAVAGRSLEDKGVRVVTVAYGDESGEDVDHDLLNTLACKSNGLALDAGVNDQDPVDPLAKQIRAAVIEGLNLEVGMDPSGVLSGAHPEVRQSIQITPYDRQVTFVVDWDTFDDDRIDVQLITPNCEVITPAYAQKVADINYHHHPRYKIFTVGESFLRNAGGDDAGSGDNPRYGLWTLIISGNEIGTSDHEPYQYEVMMDSRLKLRLSFDRSIYYAGDSIDIEAVVTLDGKHIKNANATLYLTSPGQSASNWIAATYITPAEYDQSARLFPGAGADISPIGIKAHAIEQKGLFFNPANNTRTISMHDDENQGIYSTTIDNTSVTGGYKFHVVVTGETEDGISFRRELQRHLRLGVRPMADFTLVDILYAEIFQNDLPYLQAEVRIWPRDHFGNVILVDPETDPRIQLGALHGEFTGPLVSNLDGSYSRQLRYSKDVRPVINLQVSGETIIDRFETAPLGDTHFADKLIDYSPGLEMKKGANLHTDPQLVLGDVLDNDRFVSLGGNGSITLGVIGENFVNQGADDITVYVHSDAESTAPLRAYEVLAKAVDGPEQWISLGTSDGITQAFSLASGGLKKAEAIRIVDKSGIIAEGAAPSHTPGVSISAVGFKKSSLKPEGQKGWLCCFINLFNCLFGLRRE